MKTNITGKQFDAIGWYAKQHKLKLTLSLPPTISFITEDGEIIERRITELVDAYITYIRKS